MEMYDDYRAVNFFKDDALEMRERIGNLSRIMMKFITESKFNEIERLFQECKAMRYSAQGYLEACTVPENEKAVLANAGYTRALMDIMQLYLNLCMLQNEIWQIKTKYKNEILSVLAQKGTLLHKDLACMIGVSASGLTAIIKQMNATRVKTINVEEVSKFKLYSITPAAYKYIMQNMPDLPRDEYENRQKENYYRDLVAIKKKMEGMRMDNRENGKTEQYPQIRDGKAMKRENSSLKKNMPADPFCVKKQKHTENRKRGFVVLEKLA